jgi:hypothetical protein
MFIDITLLAPPPPTTSGMHSFSYIEILDTGFPLPLFFFRSCPCLIEQNGAVNQDDILLI